MTVTPALSIRATAVLLDGHAVLHDADLAVRVGEWVAVVGPNGAGKTTLLRALGGLVPVQGHVLAAGVALSSLSARARAQSIAWLGEEPPLDDWLARELVMLGRMPWQRQGGWLPATASTHDEQVVNAAMARMRVLEHARRRMGTLSAGEKQRVRLARLAATQATVLLMDEPLEHLDPPHQADWLAWVKGLVAGTSMTAGTSGASLSVVSVLHDLNMALRADRMVVMQAGRIVAVGAPHEAACRDALTHVFDARVSLREVDGVWCALLMER